MKKKCIIGDIDNGLWKPMGYQQVTNAAGVQTLTVPAHAKFCTIQPETTTARFTDVTTMAPSTAIGQILYPGMAPFIYPGDPNNLNIWATAGNVSVLYYR